MDEPTFESIVSDHGAWIRKTLSCLGVGASDLDDVEQEVLRGVARGLPTFDPSLATVPEGALTSWLFGICERQAASHRRKNRRRAEVPRETRELDGIGSDAPSPEARLLACERKARLYAALERMEPDRLAVIVAYELEGIPMGDVAIRLRIPVNTAWNRLRLAREAIRAAFRRDEDDGP